jgi:hypothetical protein
MKRWRIELPGLGSETRNMRREKKLPRAPCSICFSCDVALSSPGLLDAMLLRKRNFGKG